jgi:transposase
MSIVGALDIHRRQITYDWLDTTTGQVRRGRVAQPDRERVRQWLGSEFDHRQDVAMALEGCTGWRYVVEELQRAGIEAHLADPAEVQAKRGRKHRAKTDQSDSRLQRELLFRGELPESWIPPAHVLEVRALVRLYKDLLDTRTAWCQRMQAVVFHHGLPVVDRLDDPDARAWLTDNPGLSIAGRHQIAVGYQLFDAINTHLLPLRRELAAFGRRQVGCRALWKTHYGIAAFTSACVWAELGDCRRFRNSAQAVRHTGLDITVYSSDDRRSPGHLTRQGPGVLRWALYEAGKCAARTSSPDHDYYRTVKDRVDGKRAALSVARRLARRCYHTLYELGDDALAPVA